MSTNIMEKGRLLTSNIVWMDLEMTGLDVRKDRILEVSCLITDKDLNIVAESPTLVINQSEEVLSSMNKWCVKNHGDSGLTEECRNSTLTTEKAESLLLEFLKTNIPEKSCPLAGNSIYVDRMFLNSYMPRLNDYMHYRIIDVSSIKELCRRWNPPVFSKQPKKRLAHRSLDDIKDTIEELKFYKENLFQI
ncbi:REXO2 family protein [Megaselia abdita]